jgi:CheY-like chemotaxis protein
MRFETRVMQPAPKEQSFIPAGSHPLSVLLVEDNQGDVRLVREALTTFQAPVQLSTADDGRKAQGMLQLAEHRPDLILLDLKLPGMDGRSLLSWIKSDPKLRRIPVIVLTSSDDARDVKQAYDLHANCYLVKPRRLGDFESLIRDTVAFWTGVARLPGSA